MKRSLNIKFIAILFVGFAVLGVGVHFLHAFQLKRNASSLLTHAQKAEEKGDLAKSIFYLRRYLGFEPANVDALLKLGLLSADHAEKLGSLKQAEGAYFILNRVLLLDGSKVEARRKVIDLAIKIQRFADARAHLNQLLKVSQEKADLVFRIGRCHKNERDFVKAAEKYKEAADLDPHMLKAYEEAAFLYRYRIGDPVKADKVMNHMVEKNPNSFEAYLSSANYYITHARNDPSTLKKADKDLQKARALDPQDARVLLVSGNLALKESAFAQEAKDSKFAMEKMKEARAFFNKGITEHPKNQAMYVALADLEARDGHADKGLDILQTGLKEVSRKGDLLNGLFDILLQKGELPEALEIINRLREEKIKEELVRYQEARYKIRKGEWGNGVEILGNIRERFLDSPALVRNIDFLRGYCYEKLGNPDQALLAYQDTVKFDPLDIGARRRVAVALLNLNRLDEALHEYAQLATFKDAPPAAPLALAHLLMVRNTRLPASKRNWTAVKELLAEAERKLPDEVEVQLLKADTILLEKPGQKKKALELLLQARTAQPDRPELWIALAALYGREKKEAAFLVLDEAARRPKLKDSRELTLARMRFLARMPNAVNSLKKFEDALPSTSKEDRQPLLTGLANAYLIAGDNIAAARIWRLLAKDQPHNLGVRLILFDLAQLADKEAECQVWLKEIRALEGKAGSYWPYCQASLIFTKAKKDSNAGLSNAKRLLPQAHRYLTEAFKLRRSWFRVPALEGMINDLEGKPERAMEYFQEAVHLGDRRPPIIRRLVQLLFDRNRFDDAERMVSLIINQDQALLSSGLGKFAATSLLRLNDVDRALEIALISVDKKSKNYRDHLWLGDVLSAVGEHDKEAKDELTKACELAPEKPQPWISLVFLLAKMDKKTEAEAVLAQAAKSLPAQELPLTLAHCHDILGNLKVAEKYFIAANAKKPGDLLTLENIATFYTRRGNQEKAEKFWQRIIDQDQTGQELLRRARRNLALCMGIGPDYQGLLNALKLLDLNMRDKTEPDDLLVKALLLSTRAGKRGQAIALFEEVNSQHPLAAKHRFTLANLYAVSGNWTKTNYHMLSLLGAATKKAPEYYSFYIRRLLDRKDFPQAEFWLAKLEQEFPGSFLGQELKIRILKARDKDTEALAQVKILAGRKGVDIGQLAAVVDDLSRQPKANAYRVLAEGLYREKARQAANQNSLLALADFLGRNKRVGEALDCCEQAFTKGQAEPVLAVALAVLRSGQADKKYGQRVEHWLRDKSKGNAESVRILHWLADLRDWQEQFTEAAEFYRQILKKSPKDVVALNNRGWILAHEGQRTEALELLESAFVIVGPLPEILDTRGVIHLRLGNSAAALKDFEASVAAGGSPTRFFHLAQAHFFAGDRRAAMDALDKAYNLGLALRLLHPLERGQYQRLLNDLNRKEPGRGSGS